MSKDFTIQADLSAATAGTLTLSGGARQLRIKGIRDTTLLYRAQFTDLNPAITNAGGAVTINYPRRLPRPRGNDIKGTVELNASVPWALRFTDALAVLHAELNQLDIVSISIECPIESSALHLPSPRGNVSVHITGPASDLTITRPVNVPIDLDIAGSASQLHVDGHELKAVSRRHRITGEPGHGRYHLTFERSVTALTVATSPQEPT
jgi:hypothetical protein